EGQDGAFRVQTNRGPMDARKVVLATGLRGTPRKIGCRGEDLAKVTYRLIDTEQYEGCDVLVVGGGDSAVEAAVQLAEQSDARVSISYRGDSFSKCRDANRKQIAGLAREKDERSSHRRAHFLYFLTGTLILTWLTLKGWSYYLLSHTDRMASPVHEMLRPAGRWGHGVGIVATLFMMSNFLYPVRKRAKFLSGKGSIRGWLDFHMFVGFMSPLVIAFHAAFQSNNQLATGTAAALLVVVLTGIIGRFIYG